MGQHLFPHPRPSWDRVATLLFLTLGILAIPKQLLSTYGAYRDALVQESSELATMGVLGFFASVCPTILFSLILYISFSKEAVSIRTGKRFIRISKLTVFSISKNRLAIVVFGVSLFLYSVAMVIFTSKRSPIIVMFWLIAIYFILNRRVFRLFAVGSIAVLLIAVSSPILEGARVLQMAGASALQAVTISMEGDFLRREYMGKGLQLAVARADYASGSGKMYEVARDAGFVEVRPYYPILVTWVPRFLWPEKPIPSSHNGHYYGTPASIVTRLQGGGDGSSAVGPGGIHYWQAGWLWVLTGGALSGAAFFFITVFVTRLSSVVVLSLYLSAFGWGKNIVQNLDALLASFAQNGTIFLPILLFSIFLVSALGMIRRQRVPWTPSWPDSSHVSTTSAVPGN